MKKITISGLTKAFRDDRAVDGIDIEIEPGEFFVIIGPTGCGKTTFLKLVAGLLTPDSGDIFFDGDRVNDVPPSKRRVRMIFETHALYPHLKVHTKRGYSNLNFPLKIMRLSLDKITEQVTSIIDRLGIGEKLFDRKPGELSEGQKQQVALGRALSVPPEVILFDEPLRDLDPQTREKSRKEILKTHDDFEATSIYVTHDLAEGFSLADRVAIMKDGRFVQVGVPNEIINDPVNSFVKSFTDSYRAVFTEAFGAE